MLVSCAEWDLTAGFGGVTTGRHVGAHGTCKVRPRRPQTNASNHALPGALMRRTLLAPALLTLTNNFPWMGFQHACSFDSELSAREKSLPKSGQQLSVWAAALKEASSCCQHSREQPGPGWPLPGAHSPAQRALRQRGPRLLENPWRALQRRARSHVGAPREDMCFVMSSFSTHPGPRVNTQMASPLSRKGLHVLREALSLVFWVLHWNHVENSTGSSRCCKDRCHHHFSVTLQVTNLPSTISIKQNNNKHGVKVRERC